MPIRQYEIQLSPVVKCLTPCPFIPGRFIASGNCKSQCLFYEGHKAQATRDNIEKGVVICSRLK